MFKLWCDVALTRNKNENCSSSELAIIVAKKGREKRKISRKYKVQLQEVPDMHALYLKYFLNSI